MFPTILIVDDEPSIRLSLEGILEDEGFEVLTSSNGYEALKIIETDVPDMVLLDIWMPGLDGIDTLKEIKKENPFLPVVMITGHGTIETAVNATKLGAFDFIEKPLSIDKVIVTINNALNFRRLEEENLYLRRKTIEKHSITGNSQAVNTLKAEIINAAPTNSSILITGENGTGKELVARTIHQFSKRPEKPIITVNCSTIVENMIESELFGHEKGAFTEAVSKKRGLFELAEGGTIFFDDVGDMSLNTQAKLLQILETKQFQRLGGNRLINADVRIIAATNKDLETEITKGNFREDLFFRLNVIPIKTPPLRERIEDIPALLTIFLKKYSGNSISGKNITNVEKTEKKITDEVTKLLQSYPWPGNVRELKNLIQRMVIMTDKDTIDVACLPAQYNPATGEKLNSNMESFFTLNNLKEAVHKFENEFLKRKYIQFNNNLIETAHATGVDEKYLKKVL
ncbi:MAG: Fis family transcriptional regulator [Desulfobacteraceae bacterium 4572_19]|nr:MAG: Fis family transcriptional regulator [Desulfobacteraceae bacterium 4572_19]